MKPQTDIIYFRQIFHINILYVISQVPDLDTKSVQHFSDILRLSLPFLAMVKRKLDLKNIEKPSQEDLPKLFKMIGKILLLILKDLIEMGSFLLN